ncbi:nuclear transport factor 2 family protein [uncultured Parasphingorhabdus sp.]|uniref:nuclear transport factor 2 family protein n=1 Tax=uncultured Parasphingorhabdus sp. TaxID=2709694 RepID=UPI0030DDCF91|tara:strand:+ start:15705 stop:16235 length:531 start_codon:yes stop_codon:yes gene_type:complete
MNLRKLFLPVLVGLSPLVLSPAIAADTMISAQSHEAAEKDQTTVTQDPKIAVVEEMITAWNERQWSKVGDLFTEDGVLHSMMLDPVVGRETIRARIIALGEGIEEITLHIHNIGRIGDVVVIERTDEFTYKGHKGKVPVVGILEVEGDKVSVWREYYDRAELIEALGLSDDFDPSA